MFKSIPNEIISHILKLLTSDGDLKQCTFVCKQWSYLALELLWYKPNFVNPTSWLAFFTVIQSTQTSFPYTSFIRRINLSPLSNLVEDIHIITLTACTRLERLTLAGCSKLTDVGLCALITHQKCHGIGAELVSIDLSDVVQVTDTTVLKVAYCCPNLQGFNLGMSQEQQSITDTSVVELARQCRNLKRIKLNNCTKITERSAIDLASHCPRLVEVDFTNCKINDTALEMVFNHCRDLRELRISQSEVTNPRISDQAFLDSSLCLKQQIKNPPIYYYDQLRLVDFTAITTITDQSLKVLINSAPKIKSLVLNKCSRITDEGLMSVCKLGRFLHFLHLGHCVNLTDRSITKLALYCSRIRYLDMACCINITDRSVIELANLPKLKRIGLVKCSNITDIAISALTSHIRISNTLERIHLSHCTQLSIREISNLLNVCHRLNHLSLTNVPSFLRSDLQAFCRTAPKDFSELQLRTFCVFSGKGVQELRDYLNTLHENYTNSFNNNSRLE
ncbi:hypothetical protein INT47_004982 [Mucor saturninus]|uniref:Uncharacterized protein n=1 Tax=Mucor saturninus TaxID=64648 RepID=A0A8H7QUI0_9FUNG|nr:hypothetical protein INT47_004982 [Mucor saturninus]